MFYSEEEIRKFGYDSIEQFVEEYVSRYKNCCIIYRSNGVYLDYDYDTNFGFSNDGGIIKV